MGSKTRRFRRGAAAATVGLALGIGGLIGSAPAHAAASAGVFEGWSCGYNSGRGIDPGNAGLTRVATDHSKWIDGNDPITADLRNGWSHSRGRWFAWGRVSDTYSFQGGDFVVAEWSDDAGRTYHACGWGNRPSYVADQTVAAYTKAFDWVRGRSARVCVGVGGNPRTHSGGQYIGCTRWYLS